MTSFDQIIDDHPEFDSLYNPSEPIEIPDWMNLEADSEPFDPPPPEFGPLDFD